VRLAGRARHAGYEIAPQEDTLEDFYLSLMNGQKKGE
jgi:hypothetical protein